jgi:hypothetical protein
LNFYSLVWYYSNVNLIRIQVSKEQLMKKFLTTFAGIAAAFASNAASTVAPTQGDKVAKDAALNIARTQTSALGENIATTNALGDQHNFVLKKSEDTGLLMAWHSSHASHASHKSHYSSR